jgi:hypothetical protein
MPLIATRTAAIALCAGDVAITNVDFSRTK